MDMESMAMLMQMMMSGNNQSPGDSGESSENNAEAGDSGENSDNGFNAGFDNINFDMLSKMGELFSHMNKPDMNAELLFALRPHLKNENRHKIDTAVKLSKMISLFPFIKDSGILNDLF
ncbi:MAG: hypothetical protein FWG83_02325 [Oscillospiraceae bacterium]|nr:hypothetical protein [Oscillospiraceae bacterium]